MHERFTERARQVVVLAQEECRLLGHDHIGIPHLLLGLIREEAGLGARALIDLGVTYDSVRGQMVMNDEPSPEEIPYSTEAKTVLEWSLREALSLGHNYIGTEHILLGVIRHQGSDYLSPVNPEDVRAKVLDLLYGPRKSKATAVEVVEDEKETIDWPCQHEPNNTYGRLVCALYLLLRDHVAAGDLEQVLLNSANALDEETDFTNPHLENLAKAHAGFLLEART